MVHGHLPQRPRVDDYLECEMDSGRMAIFRFTKVDYMSDPPDQFFAWVEDVGYRDDLDCEKLGIPEKETKGIFLG